MEKTSNQEAVSRGQFLKQLGFSGASLMAVYCMGALSACSKSEADPAPSPVNNSGKVNVTLDLTTNDFSALKTDGGFAIKDNIIIVNSGGKYSALAKACTHEGTTIGFRSGNADFRCPNHGATFNLDGTVKGGPNGSAASSISALKVFKTETLENGNKLRIFE
jgi:cytochrome b6-f complex iron-sulfur subunit